MSSGGLKVVVSAIAGNSFITVIKFIGWFFSQSPSLLAESIHSLADTLNQILLFVGLKKSKGGPTRDFPTGKGGARYLWNLISAVGMFFIGFGVTAFHGFHALLSGHYEVGPISWIGIGVLVISFIIEFIVLSQAYKEVKRLKQSRTFYEYFLESDDPTVIAVLLEDGVAVLGVSFALLGIGLGQVFQSAIFDIIASLFIALLLGLMAVLLALVNGKLLMGRSATTHKEDEISSFIQALPEVERIESLTTKIIGASNMRLSLEIEIYGHLLIPQNVLEQDKKKIEEGADIMKVLTRSSERMVRVTGERINQIEQKIRINFPEITLIDLEIH